MIDFSKIDGLKTRLAAMRPLNAGEVKRLRNEYRYMTLTSVRIFK
jgi:hypothetical protein